MERVSPGELERVLLYLVYTAQESIGARYAALAILDPGRMEIEHFVTAGIDAPAREAIGAHPRGRGVLGLLLSDPRPLRLEDISGHPASYGFPPNHPVMHRFLGVPVLIDGEPAGNLYLTDKRDGPFDQNDEHTATGVALAAASAVQRARAAGDPAT